MSAGASQLRQRCNVSIFERAFSLSPIFVTTSFSSTQTIMVDNYCSRSSTTSWNLTIQSSGSCSDDGVFREQDRLLPIANVGRIMKQILPPNAKVSKEAKETMQECVSEFISFVTGEASDRCHKEKRKTVNGDDVCWAMGSLGFDDYANSLRRYLDIFREWEGERATQNKHKSEDDDSPNDSARQIHLSTSMS